MSEVKEERVANKAVYRELLIGLLLGILVGLIIGWSLWA